MKPNRLLRQILAGLLVALLALAVLQGCTESPDEPTYDNPFDPDNPESANPFDLQAVQSEGQVILAWTMLDGYGFTSYFPQHRVESGSWTDIDTLEAAVGPTQLPFNGAVPTATNYFRVVAVDVDGFRTSTGPVLPVSLDVPPIITNPTRNYDVLSRFQDLAVAATAGDSLELSRDSLFTVIDAADARDPGGSTGFPDFDLGVGDAESTFTVYARAVTILGEGLPRAYSARGSRSFTVADAPRASLARGGSTIASTLVDLLIASEAAGVDSMRFASSEEGLAGAPWRPGAALAEDVPVLDTVNPQTVHVEYQRDFGFRTTTTVPLQADDLETADFSPRLPANRISAGPDITLDHDAVALEMRASQYPDFHDTGWVAYADSSVLTLEPVVDQYLYPLFVQYRNRWYQSPIRSDFALLGAGEIRVEFTNPLQDMIIEGGTTVEVSGTAAAFDAEHPITGVEVQLDGEFEPATGTENWEAIWEVPLLTEDTTWILGAVAQADHPDDNFFETGSAFISVIISQLTITIDTPADAAQVTRGRLTNIRGTAAPFLAGAPLDSVVVTVIDQRLRPAALAAWSVDWQVPTDAPDLVDITAIAYAGEDSVSQRIQVQTVAPATK